MSRPETAQQLAIFESWYDGGKTFRETSGKFGIPENTLYDYARRYGWYLRAETRHAAAAKIADTAATRKTAEFLIRQQEAGYLLQVKGIQHLIENDITDTRTAITAIKIGLDIERQALGMPDWITRILEADTETINAEIAVLEAAHK